MSSLYKFTFAGSTVLTVEEFEHGVWQTRQIKSNETWLYNSTTNTVTRTETEKGRTKSKTFSDINNDGIFVSESSTSPVPGSGKSQKLYDITIVDGVVTAVSESKHGTWQTETINANEQWTYDAATDTVTRIETYTGYTESTLFVRTSSGFFIRVSEQYTLTDGTNTLNGTGTDDVIYGKSDDNGDDYTDIIQSGDGDDYIESYNGDDIISTGNGNDYIDAGAGDDKSNGGNGDDLFIANDSGTDVYDGGKGNDTVNYAAVATAITVDLSKSIATGIDIGNDKLKNIENLLAGQDSDVIKGNQSANTIYGGGGDDKIDGREGHDNLYGDSGDDTLIGSQGNDSLAGGDGEDVLNGGQGKDTLTGGNGSDVFVFDTRPDKKSVDTITDFNSSDDTIHLDDAVFKKLKGITDLTDHLVIGTSAIDTDDYLIYNSETGVLTYDSNGVGKGGEITIVVLATGLTLDASDFSVI